MNRIIAERDTGGLWTAWFDELPEEIQVGRSQREAVQRLLSRTRDRRPTAKDLWMDPAACRDGHMEFVVITEGMHDPCPDCHGSGKYVGLTVVEACQTCHGTGVLS